MAGAGYKLFNTGDVLTAAQVNTYLMEQTVMVFASAAARTTALSGVLAEGMVSYLQDTNTLEVYNGSAWVGATGDITEVQAGTGISVASGTGPVPVVTNTVATTFDAKGDLVVGTGADTFAKLVVGNSGESIVADSSQTAGLRYNPPVGSLANPIINGGFDVWQRGTSIANATNQIYTADRWIMYRGTTGSTVSRQTTSDTTNLPNIQYSARVQRDSGNTSTSAIYFNTSLESVNAIPFAGKSITLSFYARAGANFSAASSQLGVQFYTGTGTDQNINNGYTGSVLLLNTAATLTTTWQRFAFNATIAATATEFAVYFPWTPVGTAGANDWYEITGVQIDVGTWTASTAPTFRRSGNTLAGELAACQRYYFQTSLLANKIFTVGQAYSTTQAFASFPLPVTMRGVPSVTFSAAGDFDLFNATGSRLAVTALSGGVPNVDNIRLDATVASGLVAGNAAVYIDDSAGNASIRVSAEL